MLRKFDFSSRDEKYGLRFTCRAPQRRNPASGDILDRTDGVRREVKVDKLAQLVEVLDRLNAFAAFREKRATPPLREVI